MSAGGVTNPEMDRRVEAIARRENGDEPGIVTVRCSSCDWTWEGMTRDASAAHAQHVATHGTADAEKQQIIDAIKARAAELGVQPVKRDFETKFGNRATAVFGSWADAVEAAGFPRPTRGGRRRTSKPVVATGEITTPSIVYFAVTTNDGKSLDWWGSFDTREEAEEFTGTAASGYGVVVCFEQRLVWSGVE